MDNSKIHEALMAVQSELKAQKGQERSDER